MVSDRMPVLFYTPVLRTSNLHVLDTILLLFISQRLTSRNLVLQYIFYFYLLTNKFVSFFVYFSGITNQCASILHCVIRFCKNRKIGYEVHLLMFTALTE